MKKGVLISSLIIILLFATTCWAQQKNLALIKPAKPGQTSEVIPITKQQYLDLQQNKLSPADLLGEGNKGITETICPPFDFTVRFGAMPGDTMVKYFKPPAACYVKSIGLGFSDIDDGGTCNTVLLSLTNSNYHCENHPPDSLDANGWLGSFYDGVWTPSSFGVYPIAWEPGHVPVWGEFPLTVVEGAVYHWIDMIFLGMEPDFGSDDFLVLMAPVGDPGAYIRWWSGDATPWPEWWGLKCYPHEIGEGTSGKGGWHVRHYGWNLCMVVEFYENTPPVLTPGGPYGTVLNNDEKTLECHISDVDATDPANAGVAFAWLFYKINDGAYSSIVMSLASGTDTDGIWEGTLPAGYMNPGDVLTYYFQAIDKAGLIAVSGEGSFSYFQKEQDILVFYNDDGTSYPSWILSPYYDNLWRDNDDNPYEYDVWVGLTDGGLLPELINMYDIMVQIDAYSPATMNDDVVGDWFAIGEKNLFWSSQDWGFIFSGGGDDYYFPADDWHNMYLGLEVIGPQDFAAGGATPLNPVENDIISGGMADFVDDSLQLFYDPDFELGFSNWIDAMTPSAGAVPCFHDADQGLVCGVHKEQGGNKAVFLGFDQLSLDTWALPWYTTTDGYHWTEPNVFSVADAALDWFFIEGDPPEIDVAPTSFTFFLNSGEETEDEITISNIAAAGSQNLDWLLVIEPASPFANEDGFETVSIETASHKGNKGNSIKQSGFSHLELEKGEPDPRRGEPVLKGSGGPDAFGYTWIDSDEPGGPVYDWIDISAIGTSISLYDDDSYEVILPFDFPFYGVIKNNMKISSNGYLTFGDDGGNFSNDPIPDFYEPNDIICPFWDDLNPGMGGTIHYHYQTAPNRFIVQYTGIQHFGGSDPYTFQVILAPSGEIRFQYSLMQGSVDYATVGIENIDGTDGLQVVFDAPYIHDNLAVRIRCESGTGWISATPTSGTIEPGNSENVMLNVSAMGLDPGEYNCDLTISSNDPINSIVPVPVTLVVDRFCNPPSLKATDVMGLPGDTIAVRIELSENPNPVDAFGFEFTYCADKLSLVSVEKGGLDDYFSFFQFYENEPGLISVGGFDPVAIPANSTGIIATVKLHVDQCVEDEACILGLQNLVDDFSELNHCPGLFTCGIPCLLGDVNMDEAITPGDAHCAFMIYMNEGTPPPECENPCALEAADIHCDPNGVTPGDALYIFLAYLDGLEPPLECEPNLTLSNDAVEMERAISLVQVKSSLPDEITFAIRVSNPAGISALGLNIGFPDDLLVFDRVTPSTVTENWQAFEGGENLAGVLNVGGFNAEAINISETVELGYISFHVIDSREQSGQVWFNELVDDVAGALTNPGMFVILPTGVRLLENQTAPETYGLDQNYPNPFNMETEIIYQIPEAGHVKLELYNSMGQKIRTLVSQNFPAGRYAARWDGRDESGNFVSSGIYLYKFEASDFSRIKKLILVK